MDALITAKGYSVLKSGLTEAQAQELQDALTVTPKLNTKFATKEMIESVTFKVFRQSPTRWYLPRAWGIERFGQAKSVITEGEPLRPVEFKGTPYDYQIAIIDSFLKAKNGLICVPCGRGKTFMAISIAARLGKRFVVVVDKEFLMNQWKGEMESLMPGIRIGIIQEDKCQVDPALYDCCIAMIQTVATRELPSDLFAGFGFTIFDECHHLGAKHFSKALQKIQTANMLGLSATPVREDGMSKVFQWYLGEAVYWEKTRDPDPTVEVKAVSIKTTDPVYHDVPVDWRGETVTARLLGNVIGCEERNREVVRWIRKLLDEPERRVLVLSERIGHLNRIEEMLSEEDSPTISYYIGGMKEAVREGGAATARVLLASYAMASEAMNIKSLNTVVLASPRKNVEQSTGRILRVQVDKRVVQPVIVDIIDDHSMYKGQWAKRSAYYKKCAYQIEDWAMGATSGVKRKAPVVKSDGCMIAD